MGLLRRVGDQLKRRWWFYASAAVAATLALALFDDTPVVVVSVMYALVNSGGVWIYCDHLDDRSPRTQQQLQLLAVALVPVGFVTVFMTPAGRRRQEAVDAADDRLGLDTASSANDTMSPFQ